MATSAEPHTTAYGLVVTNFRRGLVLSWEQPSCLDSTSLGCGYGSSGQATRFIRASDQVHQGVRQRVRRVSTEEQDVCAAGTLPFHSL